MRLFARASLRGASQLSWIGFVLLASLRITEVVYALPATGEVLEEEESKVLVKRGASYRNVAYFTNWSIYGRNFQPNQIAASSLTHILYAFADIASDGTILLSDKYADIQARFTGDSQGAQGSDLYGSFKQMYLLKKANRNLKVLLSVGGWNYSPHFAGPAHSTNGRNQFANSAVKLIYQYGLDGLDIDWEYPANDIQGNDFLLLCQAVRSAMDSYSNKNGLPRMSLSIAAPAGWENFSYLKLKSMAQVVDFFNLMNYDYSGPWTTVSAHQANLYNNTGNVATTPSSTDADIKAYIARGVPANKIQMGMPLYGRQFQGTNGLGKSYATCGDGGSWGDGVWAYKDLPQSGAQVKYDSTAVGTYTYDSGSRTLVSYDDLTSTNAKAKYITSRGLGGGMYWECSGDKSGSNSIITNIFSKMGGSGSMEQSQNNLKYPNSPFPNLRNGMK